MTTQDKGIIRRLIQINKTMKTKEYCSECAKRIEVSKEREECLDMCDKCWDELQERVKYMSDRNNRMEITRMATFWAGEIFHSDQKDARLRAFFACVMPEKPQYEVEKCIKIATN